MIAHVVSVSGGKDSTATLLLALATQPRDQVYAVFADTGNEHELTLDYVDYLEQALEIPIARLRASFDEQIARKRDYVLQMWPRKGVPQVDVDRALRALKPTGNPYLDLCIWKGLFPSRKAQFCTQELKTMPLVEHQLGFIERGVASAVWAWQGVRMDESQRRMSTLHISGHLHRGFEESGGGIYNYRPIARWSAADSFDAHREFDIQPNPLYRMGMNRVGCMPCINSSKDEVLQISKRFPGHIDRIEYWEHLVGQASKREEASFFADPDEDAHLHKRGIRNMVEWSKTQRGGQMLDWIRIHEEPAACASAYGLCE